MDTRFIKRMVNLEQIDYTTVQNLALRMGLGSRGFSAALRIIIRAWAESEDLYPPAPFPFQGKGEPAAEAKPTAPAEPGGSARPGETWPLDRTGEDA